uniref:(northern house mosquito) hypothetical protein n=1 Tax=Culex pipiens TaxID=7175 RepID=A0A8D8BVC3_CULPI
MDGQWMLLPRRTYNLSCRTRWAIFKTYRSLVIFLLFLIFRVSSGISGLDLVDILARIVKKTASSNNHYLRIEVCSVAHLFTIVLMTVGSLILQISMIVCGSLTL